MERFICIHGHFYQPPRENPWLEEVEVQDSAYPYHERNERIAAECYAPNAASRILDDTGRIIRIVNNYARISFNFGPTLLAWMEVHTRRTYEAILEADRRSRELYSGHGSALAQAHSHLILPLANRRDRVTQVRWGIRDFQHRFGRDPEGMWLPETAADLETLDILAEAGIRFTVLAPHQAQRVRPLGGDWVEVGAGHVDPSVAYLCRLPSGRSISLFFYDGPISRAVAFEKLLKNGEEFARRLTTGFSAERNGAQLVHIATDGETYGHHHPHGEMALSYALHHIQEEGLARLTNYGEFLEQHPPQHEVEIQENTSWSCAHGIERWRADCGCSTGGRPGWHQRWREPLRKALDWLREELAGPWEKAAGEILGDPWEGRDNYIDILLDRSRENVDRFLERHAGRRLDGSERSRALKLLELQRFAVYMYTSCGWFFNELSRIETVQVLQYASRALQLAAELFGDDLEKGFLRRLGKAESNLAELGSGRQVYERLVRPARVDLAKVGAHYAVSSLFEDYGDEACLYAYRARRVAYERWEAGRARVAVGRVEIASQITEESRDLSFGVLHFGDHNITGGVREFRGEEAFQEMSQKVAEAFERVDFAEVVRLLDRYFLDLTYSLKSLFRDEQRKVLDLILKTALEDVEGQYRAIYDLYSPLMRFLSALATPQPPPLQAAAEFVLNLDLRGTFEDPDADLEVSRRLLQETADWHLQLDTAGLAFALAGSTEFLAENLKENPEDLILLQRLEERVAFARTLPFEVNLWSTQNVFYEILQGVYPGMRQRAEAGDESLQEWLVHFASLGDLLSVRLEEGA